MNARQRKKALEGKSPRLLERLLGLPRGSCIDAWSWSGPKPRSYRKTRLTVMPMVWDPGRYSSARFSIEPTGGEPK